MRALPTPVQETTAASAINLALTLAPAINRSMSAKFVLPRRWFLETGAEYFRKEAERTFVTETLTLLSSIIFHRHVGIDWWRKKRASCVKN